MKLNKKTIELICELERVIGNECYNPNSFDGWTLEEGCSFRYPVTYIMTRMMLSIRQDTSSKIWTRTESIL